MSRGLDLPLMQQSLEQMVAYLAEGKINPQIYERLPLAEAGRAHELLESKHVMGKLILKPN